MYSSSGDCLEESSNSSVLLDKILENKDEYNLTFLVKNMPSEIVLTYSKQFNNYTASVILDHHAFSALENPNKYNFRFLGLFDQEFSFFEFFDNENDNVIDDKKINRSLFEDSVVQFCLGNYSVACIGFDNIIREDTTDRTALLFLENYLENRES